MGGLYGLILISTLCLSVTGSPGSGPTTCTTSGTVLEGRTAEVTCDFHGELTATNSSFFVYRSSPNSTMIMALCSWNAGNPQCRLEGGCAFKTASVDGEVTFQIPMALANHTGDYICKTLPADKANATNCSLAVQKLEVTRGSSVTCYTSSPVMLNEDTSLFCTFPKGIGSSGVTLEKHCPETGNTEEIVHCNEEEGCSVPRTGYVVDDKAATYLRVSIPHVTPNKAGTYICRATHIKQERGMCAFDVKEPDKSNTVKLDLKHILPPIYAILACFMLLIVVGLVAFCQHRSRRSNSNSSIQDGSQDSEKGLLDGNGNCVNP